MKAVGVILICLLASDLLVAITVKPVSKLQQATSVENRVEGTKSDSDRVVRYIPQQFSPSSLRHHHQLNNLNLVRYLQSLPKAQPQIPSIAYLYGSSKHTSTPQVQAGFIYKARTQNYSNNNNNNAGNKDSYPISATMYPIYNRQEAKYSQVYSQKPQTISKVKLYSPFSPSNKIPGPWLPINFKPYYTKVIHEDSQKEYVSPIQHNYESSQEEEEEFIPISNPQYIKHLPHAPPAYKNHHHSNKIHSLKPEKSITIHNPAAIPSAVPTVNYEADKPLAYVIASTTTTELPISITTEYSSQSSSPPSRPEYEFEEQLLYELPGNKSRVNIEHTTRINYIDDHEDEVPPLPELPYGPIELYKPRANLTKITPVPNDFKYYKMAKINSNPAVKTTQKDYYDKDIENDYNDDVVKDGSPRPSSGRPGIDFPILHEIPETSFSCKEQRYKGFFGDVDTGCQVWHYCDLNGGKASFLCPNGTIFSQHALTCDWWFNVKCATTAQLYVLNERLYKYILPFTPKFPQDFQGPLVDKYLTIKFEEMEEKLRKEKEEKANNKEEEKEPSSPQFEDNEIDEAHYGTVEEEIIPLKLEEQPSAVIESTTKSEITETTEESSSPTLTTIVYEHEQQLQSIEPEVEIKNVGASGHLTQNVELS